MSESLKGVREQTENSAKGEGMRERVFAGISIINRESPVVKMCLKN